MKILNTNRTNQIPIIQIFASLLYVSVAIRENNLNIAIFYVFFSSFQIFFGKEKKEFYIYTYNITAIIGIFFYYSLLYYYGEPYYVGGSDDKMYELWSLDILEAKRWYDPLYLTEHKYLPYGHNSPLYVILLSFIRIICSYFDAFHTIIPKLVNAFLLALTSCFIFDISQSFFNKRNSRIIALVYGLFPALIEIANYSFRDTFVAFLFISGIYLTEKTKSNAISIILLFLIISILSFLLFYLRHLYVPIFVGIIFIRYYIRKRNNTLNFAEIVILFFSVLLIVLPLFDISFFLLNSLSENYTSYRAEELSSGLGRSLFQLPLFPLGIVLRYFYLLIPFGIPNEFASGFYAFGGIIQYFFLPFFLYGSYIIFKNNKSFRIYIIFIHVFLIMIAITSFTWRHLTIIYPFFIMISVQCMLLLDKRKRVKIISFSVAFMLVLFGTYLTLKSML